MIAHRHHLDVLHRLFDSSIHVSVAGDPVLSARHRAFISSHVLGALLSLSVFLVFLLTVGLPTPYAIVVSGWFLTPSLIALYLSKTGKLAIAHFLSAANLIGLVVLAAAVTGGIGSFVIVWMIVVPLEAALSASRRIIVWSCAAAMAALIGLYAATLMNWLPTPLDAGFAGAWRELFSHLAAACYSTALALNVESIHRQSAQRTEEAHARYRLLADNATDLISRHASTGEVVFASPASHSLTGEAPRSLLQDGLLERVLVADRPAYLAALSDASRGESTDVEFRLRRQSPEPNGAPSYFWAEMRCRPAEIGGRDGGAPVPRSERCEVVAITRDVSRRKRYEDELLQARTTADGANRAKSLFLANMSHELRTPLNAIIGFSEILLNEMKSQPEHARWREHSGIIRDSGQQLLVMVNELLDISKIESGHYRLDLASVDAAEIARACCATLRPVVAKKEQTLTLEVCEDLPDIEADARCLRQILINLLGNAIKFSKPGMPILLRLRHDATALVIEVVDKGIGIDPGDFDRLGQPFVQLANGYGRQHEGTGLGLSLVKGMTRLHGGELAFASEPGKGTTVSLRLPRSQGGPAGRPVPASEPVSILTAAAARLVPPVRSLGHTSVGLVASPQVTGAAAARAT